MFRLYIKRFYSWLHKKAGLKWYAYNFSGGYDIIDVDEILSIYKNLMKKHNIK